MLKCKHGSRCFETLCQKRFNYCYLILNLFIFVSPQLLLLKYCFFSPDFRLANLSQIEFPMSFSNDLVMLKWKFWINYLIKVCFEKKLVFGAVSKIELATWQIDTPSTYQTLVVSIFQVASLISILWSFWLYQELYIPGVLKLKT